MACTFLNRSFTSLNPSNLILRNWSECYKGLDEYSSDEELAQVILFLDYPDALLKFSAACTFIFMVLGIPGNIITIVALSKYRKVRNATAIFIINLSVSDLLFACIILPLTISMFLNHSWMAGKVMCLIFPVLNYTLNAASVFTIVAITINRYVLVSHPLHYAKLYQTRNITIMIIAIWVGAFGMLVPILSEICGRFSLDPKVSFCTVIPDKNDRSPKTAIVTMGFIFPCFILLACYGRIMYLVRKSTTKSASRPAISNLQSDARIKNQEISTRELTSSENIQEDENGDDIETGPDGLTNFKKKFNDTFRRRKRRVSTAPTKRDKRLRTMIMAIIITFFTCHLPIMIAKTASEDFAMGPYGNIMGYMLLYMTVCSNPIIYVVMSKEYRQAYTSVFGFLRKR